jgi:hypothetical protein
MCLVACAMPSASTSLPSASQLLISTVLPEYMVRISSFRKTVGPIYIHSLLTLCVCVCVCVCVGHIHKTACGTVLQFVCMYIYIYMYVFMYICMYVIMYVCMYLCMKVTFTRRHVVLHYNVYVCMYV